MLERDNTQFRKPHGKKGVETIKNMNREHNELYDFSLEHINLKNNMTIIDIGCGGGVAIKKFLDNAPNSIVNGIDYSDIAVKEAKKYNEEAIKEGRCTIINGNVMNMPFDENSYDLASTFESVYFWPDLELTFKEVYRILKNKGKFMIVCETDGNHPDDKRWEKTIPGMKIYNKEQLRNYLSQAGFVNIKTYIKENKHNLIIISEKIKSEE